ncbi:hypothetical protein [Dethiosulfatarculus sandiegensis]|uniref:Uncharacterized protein n=1 Tax=Dethiosulfatarculus sandiegensis TaxID=1429043 RepID=A0A0D2JGB9_9BACT|nr:hypothetical protein [Dethiosulfatarculus sandiegensis]KIX14781.1 hypothetical protein X474_06460 [Dethiosulfatarculus sandiegensis]
MVRFIIILLVLAVGGVYFFFDGDWEKAGEQAGKVVSEATQKATELKKGFDKGIKEK